MVDHHPAAHHRYTYAEYLDLEEVSNVKHEYLAGAIYAMAGGTPEHAEMAAALISMLSARLRGSQCRVYSSDLRVRVTATGLATYPDVTVVCGPLERDPGSHTTIINPTAVFEILSDSTEAYDRGDKLDHYRQISSLRECVLISHREPLVEVWSRGDEGGWNHGEARAGETVSVTGRLHLLEGGLEALVDLLP